VSKPSRYFVEWEDLTYYRRLRRLAEANGSYSPDHDDWFNPIDIVDKIDAGDDIENARIGAKEIATTLSQYDQARIVERVDLRRDENGLWDWVEREVETVEGYNIQSESETKC